MHSPADALAAVEQPPHAGEPGRASPPRPLRVAILADMLEEKWPSMDLVAESLMRELASQPGLAVTPELVRPRLVPVTRPWQSAGAPIPTRDRVFNRFWLYRRALRASRDADVFHVVDHSYAHLATHLPAAHTVVTCHDTDAFESRDGAGLPAFLVRRLVRGVSAAAMVTCPSQSTADALAQTGLVPQSRLAVVPNGVDVAPRGGDRSPQFEYGRLGVGEAVHPVGLQLRP